MKHFDWIEAERRLELADAVRERDRIIGEILSGRVEGARGAETTGLGVSVRVESWSVVLVVIVVWMLVLLLLLRNVGVL